MGQEVAVFRQEIMGVQKFNLGLNFSKNGGFLVPNFVSLEKNRTRRQFSGEEHLSPML